jgi:hypothetical protein
VTATYDLGDITEADAIMEQIRAIAFGLAPQISPVNDRVKP